jgi:hypothetical protein
MVGRMRVAATGVAAAGAVVEPLAIAFSAAAEAKESVKNAE